MTEEQMRAWIKRLIEINKSIRNTGEIKLADMARLTGYIESLENIKI